MITIDSMQKLGRDGAEAATRSLGVMSTGAQAATSEAVEFAKRSFEQASSAAERLLAVRSVESLVQLQSEFLRSSYENLVAQTSKMGELAVTTTKDAFAPVEGLFAKATSAR